MSQTTNQLPSPEHIFNVFNAYQQTAALRAGIELDLFTGVAEGAATAKSLAQRRQASERGVRILCDYLVVAGLLTKSGDRYGLTPDSAVFLDRRSPAYIGGAVQFLNSSTLTEGFRDLAAAVRKGGTVASEQGTVAPEHPVWVDFARSMAPLMAPAADGMAELVGTADGRSWKVLDIAAGHGLFGIAIAKRNPKAEIVALDWPKVLDLAMENARAAGVAGRMRPMPGSAFDVEYGNGYDLVLLTNFLHHFDPPTCVTLLRKVHGALKPGGRAVTLEFVPNEDRVSPPAAATFSLMMLGSTASGDAYTFSEFDRMFREAGFARNENHPLPPTPENVILSFKV